MSHAVSESKHPKEVAEFVYLLHGAEVDDPKFDQGLKAILEGVTSSHAGALLRFSDKRLFDKYVKDSGIPYSITQDETGQKIYAVEINFGPDGSVGLGDTKSHGILYSQIEACLSTNLLSPVLLTPAGQALLDDRNTLRSKLISFFKRDVDIGATSVIQETLIPKKFRDKNDLKTIWAELKVFADDLERAEANFLKKPRYPVLMKEVDQAFETLRLKLAPDMPMAEFKGEMSRFMSIGTQAREVATIPLDTDRVKVSGLSLESMLQFMVDQKNGAPYNLILNNCAHYLRKMIMHAAKNDPKILKLFENRFFSEENFLGWVGSVLSPHGNMTDFDSPDVATPVTMARMFIALQKELNKFNQQNDEPVSKRAKYDALSSQRQSQLSARKIRGENVDPNLADQLTPRYVLNIYTTKQNGNTLSQHTSSELDLAAIAKKVCTQLNDYLETTAFEVFQEDKKTYIFDADEKPLIAIEKNHDNIQVTCYDDTTNLDEFLAKAIHEQIKVDQAESLHFNIMSNQDVPEYDEIFRAIKNEYLHNKQVDVRMNGQHFQL